MTIEKVEAVTTLQVSYLAHPVSGDVVDNAAATREWLRYLLPRVPQVAFCCPWLPYLDVLNDGSAEDRARGRRDSVAMAKRCQGITLCGSRISEGMRLELDAVVNDSGGWVVDLTQFGLLWPPDEISSIGRRASSQIVALFNLALDGK